jgi:hypothetical protein
MKKIECEITGITPLLMHSPQGMEVSVGLEKSLTRIKKKEYNTVQDAEKVAYRTKDGKLCVPARCLKASMINASSWFKIDKRSAKQVLAGGVMVEPYELLLNQKDYEIDLRTVVIQKKDRIMRARPRFDKWKLNFTIVYDNILISNPEILKVILVEAGKRIGLLDNRPQKFGDNGIFEVTKFKELP